MMSGSRLVQFGYLTLLIVGFATQPSTAIAVYFGVALFFALAALRRLGEASRFELGLLAWMSAGPASLLLFSIPRIGPVAIFHFFVAISAALAAFGATRDAAGFRNASKWSLIVSQAAVLAFVASVGVIGFPLERLIAGHSSNGITSYMIVLQVNYCVVSFVLDRRIPWATMLATMAICIVGYGRGSIVSSGGLLALSLIASIFPRHGRSALFRVLMVMSVVAGVIALQDTIVLFGTANTKIGSGLADDTRLRMMREYLQQLNVFSVFTGGSYEGTVISTVYNANPHNSYIRAHHTFGIVYLLMIATLPFVVVVRAHGKVWERIYLFGLLTVLYVRAYTEPILFPTAFDFFFFATCFIMIRAPRKDPGPATASLKGALNVGAAASPTAVRALLAAAHA